MAASQRVLSTTELLQSIFDYMDDLESPVFVCKRWSHVALNMTWRIVVDVYLLLHLLAPVASLGFCEGTGVEIYGFTRPIGPEDWARFDKYSWRVLELYIHDEYLHPSLFDDVARSRPRDVLLPNLRKLSPTFSPRILSLFGRPSLQSLTLYPETDELIQGDRPRLEHALLCLTAVTPYLQHLTIDFGVSVLSNVEEQSLIATIKELRSLKSLVVPCRWLIPSVTEVIASLPKLQILNAFDLGVTDNDDNRRQFFSCPLQLDSFPVLEQLQIVVQYRRLVLAFSQAFSPNRLSSITLTSPMAESLEDFGFLLEVIAKNSPQLETLRLSDLPGRLPTFPSKGLTMLHLSPLLSCSKLRVITLSQTNPFLLHVQDVVAIAEALPCLTELHLYSLPHTYVSTLHLSVLSALANVPSRLEVLDVEMDVTADYRLNADDKTSFARLSKLRTLSVRSSLVSEPVPVATFLSRVLPKGCSIDYLEWIGPQVNQWSRVRELVRSFSTIRTEERKWHPAEE